MSGWMIWAGVERGLMVLMVRTCFLASDVIRRMCSVFTLILLLTHWMAAFLPSAARNQFKCERVHVISKCLIPLKLIHWINSHWLWEWNGDFGYQKFSQLNSHITKLRNSGEWKICLFHYFFPWNSGITIESTPGKTPNFRLMPIFLFKYMRT